jgi:hypothetical protein
MDNDPRPLIAAPRHDPLPFGQPRDYPVGVRFIRPHELARLNGEPVDLIQQLRQREHRYEPTAGERLVEFFRRNGELVVASGCYVLTILIGMYFAYQLGRGLL